MIRIAFVLFFISFPAFGSNIYFHGCTDNEGIRVEAIEMKSMQYVSTAWHRNNKAPIILYNPDVIEMSDEALLFWNTHECGVHQFDFDVEERRSANQSQKATCWAIKTLFGYGYITYDQIPVIEAEIENMDRNKLSVDVVPYGLQSCLEYEKVVNQIPAHHSDQCLIKDSVKFCYMESVKPVQSDCECVFSEGKIIMEGKVRILEINPGYINEAQMRYFTTKGKGQ